MSIQDDCDCDDSELEDMLLLLEAMKAADECCDIVCAKKCNC
jgi:hypothetical protein